MTKAAGSGGQVTSATCKEQIFYEFHDPAQHFTPDVIDDFSHVTVDEVGPDQVRIQGAAGPKGICFTPHHAPDPRMLPRPLCPLVSSEAASQGLNRCRVRSGVSDRL
ncbi:acyclic terpene utilization AtuA family protein [Microvirga guangxiensis]|uniref:acyclic terpene utilization AtuA family protein n=1 Tax=Microvirga guangxiensis TaxID=549386 RepID=UPI000B8599F2|nr:acyclic terpene utilization AtuA family protein [Microvirga guangxiensis]